MESKKSRPISTTLIRTPSYIAEMIVDYIDPLENPPMFMIYDTATGTTSLSESLEVGGKEYVPFESTSGYVQGIKFPSGTEDYGSERELFDRIRAFIHAWVQTDEFSEKLAAYYVMFTWVYDDFNEVPYLRILADFQSGKTRFGIEVLGAICYKALPTIAVSSLSALFRAMDTIKGTVILDEADMGDDSDKTSELVQMLNSGYKKGVPVLRSERGKGGGFDMGVYHVFGPKVICSRANMRDNALESRCLPIQVEKLTRDDISLVVTDALHEEAGHLRNQLLQFRFDSLSRGKRPVNEEFSKLEIQPRARQLLMIISSVISDEGMLEELKEYAYSLDEKNAELIANSVHAEVVAVLREAVHMQYLPPEPPHEFHMSFKDVADKVMDARATGEIVGYKFVRHISFVCKESELKLDSWKGKTGNGVRFTAEKINELCKKYGIEPATPIIPASAAAADPTLKDLVDGLVSF